jgi:hypothetical protein
MLIAKVIKVNLSDLISSSLFGDLLYQSNLNLVSSNGSWKTSQVKSSRSHRAGSCPRSLRRIKTGTWDFE